MDFHSLARKDLQTLCKKNKIPANITNVAMAEALSALQEVAGIEEVLNPIASESKPSEDGIDNESPRNCRTSCKTSTRRKPVKEESPFTQSIIRTRRGRMAEMAEQENKDLNISSTPLLPSNRRRAPVPSARKVESQSIEGKEEKDQNNEDQKRHDVLETPSIPKTQRKVSAVGSTRRNTDARIGKSSLQGACSTRRSMRLLEKTMESLSLMGSASIEPVVADKVFEELPERIEFCEHKIDSKSNAFEENLSIEDEPEDMNETKDEEEQADEGNGESKEKGKMEDEIEEDTITVKEPEDKIQSEAAIEKVFSAESSLLQEKVDLHITVQRELIKDNSDIIKEMTVEFNIEDLVDINVEEAEFQCVNSHDSISEPKMEVQGLSNGESSVKEIVESDIGELIDVHVVESDIQQTCNVEEQVKDIDSKDSLPEPKLEDLSKSDEIPIEDSEKIDNFEPKLEDLSKSDEIPIEDSEKIDNFSFLEPKTDVDLSKSDEIPIEDSEKIDSFSFPEPKTDEDLRKSDEIPLQDSEQIDNFSFTPFAVDQIQGQFPRPAAEVKVQESRTYLKIFDAADEDKEDMKNKSNEKEEMNLSLRQLRKMVKELHLGKKSNKEKTYGKDQVEKVARTALQPLSENCLAKDAQDKTTTTAAAANSMFIQ